MDWGSTDNEGADSLAIAALRAAGALTRPFEYRGFWRAAKLIGKSISRGKTRQVSVGEHSVFEFFLSDPYWSRLVYPKFEYEPEISLILQRVRSIGFSFFDCGANFGYWSVFCSDRSINCNVVIAIEAVQETFARLERNRNLNSNQFTALCRAVHSASGREVFLHEPGDHVQAFVTESRDSSSTGSVLTVSIDDLVREYAGATPVVLKLDVEGAEIPALQGATETLEREALIIYEDHGRDPTSAVSNWILTNTDLHIYYVQGTKVLRTRSAEEVSALKPHREKGYNFFATKAESLFCRKLTG